MRRAEGHRLVDELPDEPLALLDLAQDSQAAGLDDVALRAGQRIVDLSPGRTIEDAPHAIESLVYPSPYLTIVADAAKQAGIPTTLLQALVRQESAWDPGARSIAGASGLTQIMPETGAAIARALGVRTYHQDDLLNPATSLRFGAWYLGQQLALFDGDVFQAVAAYNAGAGPVADWIADDVDAFIENIDYPEKRAFVQMLYVHATWYARLAEPPDPDGQPRSGSCC